MKGPGETVVDRLRAHAATMPDKDAVVFVREQHEEAVTYRQLDQHAGRIASWLRAHGRPGDRILLPGSTGLEFVTAFFGCVYAGMIAVPTPLPGRFQQERRRLRAIANDAGVATVLTSTAQVSAVREWAEEEGLDLAHSVTDTAGLGGSGDWFAQPADPDTVVLLQYTSGSTSDAKGVMVSHGNLIHNAELTAASGGWNAHDNFGGWLPLFHDMGLIGQVITPLLIGGTTALMEPGTFVRRPHEWLRMIDRHRLSASPAPNFAFDLCRRRVTDTQLDGLDLSGWISAVNGSEPVHAPTLAAFVDRFAAAGFRADAISPSYGMAEATLYVSGESRREPVVRRVDAESLAHGEFRPVSGDGRDLVSCGRPRGFDVRIVDPDTAEALPEGRVGEIWLRGPSVARGYWRRAALSAEVFEATALDGDGGYLRTGDAGVLVDGELYITGRYKEMLVVHGRNLFPQDLEHEVRLLHEGLAGNPGAVFAVSAPDDEIVVAHEIRATREGTDLGAIAGRIRQALGSAFGVHIAGVVLLRPGAVRRTTSGKIQRLAMRELFLAGALDAVHEDVVPSVRALVRQS
ncbi:fatty acyl-AMP ligase [Solihabitans fulvus]|uniref:Fatty acyl-AMP ligase n=1 Tax=Solihabitans fulvus TaxID=1892852 RepID=A0A5B2WEX2_9PSEU|nr:fatty acyl-AMP ligase [Solihabitans fulvus]KAA2250733.1 fatty acyl-AMP ligase [Solihabitans fulvus]